MERRKPLARVGFSNSYNVTDLVISIIGELLKSPKTVMPDLIRHPEGSEITEFLLFQK